MKHTYEFVVSSHNTMNEQHLGGARKDHIAIDGSSLCSSARSLPSFSRLPASAIALYQYAYAAIKISQPCMKCRRQLRRHLRELNATGSELVLYHGSTQSAINLQEAQMFLHLTPKRAQRFVELYGEPGNIYVHAYKVHGRLLEFREYRRLGIPVPREGVMNNWARMEENLMIYKIMKHNIANDRNDLSFNSFATNFSKSGNFDVSQQRYLRSIDNEYIGHWQLEEGVRTVCVYDADRSLELVKKWRVK